MLRCENFLWGELHFSDSRMAAAKSFNSMGIGGLVLALYPRLYAAHELAEDRDEQGRSKLPPLVRISYGRFNRKGANLLDMSFGLYFYIGSEVPAEFLEMPFDVQNIHEVDINMLAFPVVAGVMSEQIRSIMFQLEENHTQYLQLCFVCQGVDADEAVFSMWMVEDGNAEIETYIFSNVEAVQ
ncbi:hypothetical protein BX666DRAFT_1930324 [Dichotomocladium elegans]|nr:hypothetical protein BX666DRAFT_1930324 [Dichotomocladium elegans]